jgi:hypothetical protein
MILESLLWSAIVAVNAISCTMKSLPAVIIEDPSGSCATTTYRVQFPRCTPATPAMKKLNRIIEERSRSAADYDDAVEKARNHGSTSPDDCNDTATEISGECELPYRVGSVLSFKCRRNWSSVRSGNSPFAINVDVASRQIKELKLADLLEPGALDRLWTLVRQDLRNQGILNDEGAMQSETGPLAASQPEFNLTPSALLLDFGYHFNASHVTAELPYSSLNGILKRRFFPPTAPHR